EAADLIIEGVRKTIASKTMTYDLARLREAIRTPKRDIAGRKSVEEDMQRLIPGATLVGCTGFGDAIIDNMG
ncbi:MAG: NADP-dependent isocitrate dehydrogenase, partial [Gammaproteobacteria bacterium]